MVIANKKRSMLTLVDAMYCLGILRRLQALLHALVCNKMYRHGTQRRANANESSSY